MINRHGVSPITRRPAAWLAAALLMVALAAPSAALASSPTHAQYEPKNQQIAATGGGGSTGGPSAPSRSTIGSLPFTGLDVGVLALAAVALLGAGFALRRLSDPTRHSSS